MDPNLTELGIPTSTLLAMAAMFLGLAVIVQVLQEIYKYFVNSKASVYRMVLTDFFGSWVDQLYEPGPVARFHVRGPFQWFKSQPTGVLLPLSKEELLQALDELPTGWMGETLKVLKQEARLGPEASAAPTPALQELIEKLKAEVGAGGAQGEVLGPGAVDAQRMLAFLTSARGNTAGETLSPAVLLERFYQRFFPDRIRAEEEFDRLKSNFDHANERRNLCLSFLFALVIAVGLNFPFDTIYRRAQALSPEHAIQLAEDVQKIHDDLEADATTATQVPPSGEPAASQESPALADPEDQPGAENAPVTREELEKRLRVVESVALRIDPTKADGEPVWKRGWIRVGEIYHDDSPAGYGLFTYFFNCLITALLVSFGAPFWDRITDSLLARAKKAKGLGGAEVLS